MEYDMGIHPACSAVERDILTRGTQPTEFTEGIEHYLIPPATLDDVLKSLIAEHES